MLSGKTHPFFFFPSTKLSVMDTVIYKRSAALALTFWGLPYLMMSLKVCHFKSSSLRYVKHESLKLPEIKG